MNKYLLSLCLFLFTVLSGIAQPIFPNNGVSDQKERAYAFINATVYVDYQNKLENATLLIKNGKVENVGQDISIPKAYFVIDLKHKFIYPSFIDPYTQYGLKMKEESSSFNAFSEKEQIESLIEGAYNGNESIKSDYQAARHFSIDKKAAKSLRNAGFGSVLSFRADGLARGSGVLVSLFDESDNIAVINDQASAHYSFSNGSSKQIYPISPMGYVALLRQSYLNAEWYAAQDPPPFTDLALEGWNNTQSLPQLFDTDGWLEILRADKLGDEFGVQYIIKGGGDEYQRIEDVKATGAKLIIPLNFPDVYDMSDPLDAQSITLAKMKHWEMAPSNPAALEKAQIDFCFTADGLTSIDEYLSNIKKAIQYGLSEETALKAMTYTPASFLNEGDRLGQIKTGSIANFIICSAPLFSSDNVILENWVQGNRYEIKNMSEAKYEGDYLLHFDDQSYQLEIVNKDGKQKCTIHIDDSTQIDVKAHFENNLVEFSFKAQNEKGYINLSGWKEDSIIKGKGQLIDGTWIDWYAEYQGAVKETTIETSTPTPVEISELLYPFTAYGNSNLPQQENILIKNATLWTNEEEGIIKEADILLVNGKISAIGQGLSDENARVIDAEGKHVTSGIIDEHSHIAANSVNDLATNSSMVRIGDIINPSDVNIYYALSGGVTAVQVLHGSANPIGGQSALIKLRWGEDPEGMKIKGADGFIKFALGENVKRNYNPSSIRFPQSRMGVEQVYVDAFNGALEYENEWITFNNLNKKEKANALSPRRDLAMETMLEILNEKRFISCHSYVQSEINMLMNVADDYDFKVNTFTHILEGYKVADKMKAHGAGASTFSDWWAYKWEVRYAIPYNAAIMNDVGLIVAINSDDAEMGRRLNQEAAKTIKYGGLSEEEAWKTVTLNPAKLLHLDEHMGSLKEGKDADIVIWSGNPLSIYAIAETTIIDGAVYFDITQDKEKSKEITKERARLIQKMMVAKENGAKTQKVNGSVKHSLHCDDIVIDGEIQIQ
jgi:imidazolonepropionase-like amidohydrolase